MRLNLNLLSTSIKACLIMFSLHQTCFADNEGSQGGFRWFIEDSMKLPLFEKGEFEASSINVEVKEHTLVPRRRVHVSWNPKIGVVYDFKTRKILEFVDAKKGALAERGEIARVDAVPLWTNEECIDRAMTAVKIFGASDFNFGQPQITWSHNWLRKDSVSTPFWFISLQRVSKAGHRYLDDRITMKISEMQGLYVYKARLFTEFDEGRITELPNLDLKQASLDAKTEVHKTMDNPAFSSVLPIGPLVSADEPASVELCIVRPNYFNRKKRMTFTEDSRQGDPAWVFWFGVYKEDQDSSGVKDPVCFISVWLDAETGDYLGGDIQG